MLEYINESFITTHQSLLPFCSSDLVNFIDNHDSEGHPTNCFAKIERDVHIALIFSDYN